MTKEEAYVLCQEIIKLHTRAILNLLEVDASFLKIVTRHGGNPRLLGSAHAEGTCEGSGDVIKIVSCTVFIQPDSIYSFFYDRDEFVQQCVKTLAHELKHVWQYYSGWYGEYIGWGNSIRHTDAKYFESPHEVEARRFAEEYLAYCKANDLSFEP